MHGVFPGVRGALAEGLGGNNLAMAPAPVTAIDASRDQRKPKARGVRTHDLAVVGRIDRVTAPKQARSERSLQRVLAALESLLERKTFGEISIPEIAARSECSAATIYGRFKDKQSILAALHESLRERLFVNLCGLLEPQRWVGCSVDELVDRFCSEMVAFYRRDRNLLAATLVMGDHEVYVRAGQNIAHAAKHFTAALQALAGGTLGKDVERSVEVAVRAVFALLQQRALYRSVAIGRPAGRSDAVFCAELALLLRTSAQAAR